ncbi:MAG: hypothetical protein ACHQNT_07580 [Bacteroidia bacterium]
MKTKKIIPAAVIAIALASIFITGCKKDKEEDSTTGSDYTSDVRIMYDQSVADASFDDAGNVADEGVARTTDPNAQNIQPLQTSCATITVDTVSIPHTATIVFSGTPASPCLCNDGNYRTGTIIVSWTAKYRDPGSFHTITFQDYYLNFNKIDGTKTVSNNGANGSGNLTFTIDVQGSIVIDPQYSYNGTGGTITFTSNRTREWIAGEPTPQWNDDIYLISGTASGTTTSGASYSMSTDPSAPLRKEIGFTHFTSGILNITPSGKPTRTINYSYLNSNRDNLALLTVNGVTRTIYLGRRDH